MGKETSHHDRTHGQRSSEQTRHLVFPVRTHTHSQIQSRTHSLFLTEKKHTNHSSRAPSLTSGTQPYSNSTSNAPSTSPRAHTRRQSSRCQVCRKLWCSPKRIRSTRSGITLRIWMRGFRLDGSCPGCREGRMLVVRARRNIECG